MKISEGYMPFKNFKTYFRIVGEKSKKPPLICLHGGPGSTHNYFEVLDSLSKLDNRQIISYDQIGCGNSYIENHPELFNKDIWMEELFSLIKFLNLDSFHIMGQSWGGMMAIVMACDYNVKEVKSYILSSANPSASLWKKEQFRMIKFMEKRFQDAIEKAEKTKNFNDPLYKEANEIFMKRHCFNTDGLNLPLCITREKKQGNEAYLVAWGPSEFNPMGNLKDFEYLDKLNKINKPTLITNGVNDLCTPLIAKKMYDKIKNSKWEIFENSRHMPFVEENNKYINLLIDWLNKVD